MPRFDATSSLCRISVKREGLLSAAGHDLQIGVADYAIEIADSGLRIDATFAAGSVYAIDAVDRAGQLRLGTLSAQDKASIDRNIAHDVLEAATYPTIEFHSDRVEPGDGAPHRVQGRLRLHGREQPLRFDVTRRGDQLVAEVVLHQPDFGIRPFRAFAGALRIRPELRVHIALPFTPPAA